MNKRLLSQTFLAYIEQQAERWTNKIVKINGSLQIKYTEKETTKLFYYIYDRSTKLNTLKCFDIYCQWSTAVCIGTTWL